MRYMRPQVQSPAHPPKKKKKGEEIREEGQRDEGEEEKRREEKEEETRELTYPSNEHGLHKFKNKSTALEPLIWL